MELKKHQQKVLNMLDENVGKTVKAVMKLAKFIATKTYLALKFLRELGMARNDGAKYGCTWFKVTKNAAEGLESGKEGQIGQAKQEKAETEPVPTITAEQARKLPTAQEVLDDVTANPLPSDDEVSL